MFSWLSKREGSYTFMLYAAIETLASYETKMFYNHIFHIYTFFSQRFSRAPDPVPADLQVRPGNGQLRHVDQAEDSLLHGQVLVVVVDATVYRKVSISRHFHFFADKKTL